MRAKITGKATPKPRAKAKVPPSAPMRGERDRMNGYRPAMKQTAAPKAGGGIDLPKFASEVSTNYARGVAQAGSDVNRAIASVRKLAGSNAGIDNAMRTGADSNNPLKRILRNGR